ncbi:hypothetical protein [Embleya sp. NPDC050493]|uniref:hypothetical protein n=1 Tax=Embleya sp. NPDC050493 TaxID=3363989 RepID=UPI0037B8950F
MDDDAECARKWLAAAGVTAAGDGMWLDAETPGAPMTGNELAHQWTSVAMTDPDLDGAGRLRLAFGFLDLLDDYWVTCEMGFALQHETDPTPAAVFWAGYRARLEAEREYEAVTYSLWVDWFEDRSTVEHAFAEVLGNDLPRLHHPSDEHDRDEPLLRRTRRVLECSGPVPWPIKHPAYQTATRLPELHPALFKALRGSYLDLYGSLDIDAALTILRELRLPPDTPDLATLRTVLEDGHSNHYRSPKAWPAAAAS